MEPILPGAPWLIAHRSMLKVNKPYKITLNSQDYVLWQNQQGEVFALDNVCPHMQAPLSDGWICQNRNTIACPFHALEFDGQGRLYEKNKQDVKPITKSLELKVVGDCIWTYAGFKPKLPVPDLISKITEEYDFFGISGQRSIQGDFLTTLMINYDYNHQNGTHRQVFGNESNKVFLFEKNGCYAKVVQEVYRANLSRSDVLQNPGLLTIPKAYTSNLEYTFPSITIFKTQLSLGKIAQVHILYPQSENRTKTFVLAFGKLKYSLLKPLLQKSFLKAINTSVEQDASVVESLYPKQQPKIRLPNEEIMFYAEKLYREW